MCPEVCYNGEYVDEAWLNAYLSNPKNQQKIKEEQEAVKKQQAREREQIRRNNKKKAESDKQKAAEYFHKYRQEIGPDVEVSEEYARILWQRAYNAVQDEHEYERQKMEQEEWHRQMEQKEKQDRERKEQEMKQRQE